MVFHLVPIVLIGNTWPVRYSEEQLSKAIQGATSWRQVNTRLGRSPDARLAALRDRAQDLGIDTSHIVNANARTYSDDELREAVAECRTWAEVAARLGKRPGASLRAAADSLGLDVSHLGGSLGRPAASPERDARMERLYATGKADLDQLSDQFMLSRERCRQIVRQVERTRADAGSVSAA